MNLNVVRPCLVATRRMFQRVLGADIRMGRPQVVPALQLESRQAPHFAALSIHGAHKGLLLVMIPDTTQSNLVRSLAERGEPQDSDSQVMVELMAWLRSAIRSELKRLEITVDHVHFEDAAEVQSRLQMHGPWILFPASSTFGQLRLAYAPPREPAVNSATDHATTPAQAVLINDCMPARP